MNASDDELRSSADSCEYVAEIGAAIVIGAVVLEIALGVWHPPYDSGLNIWGTTLADCAIAVGIGAEVLFARISKRRETELSRRANLAIAAAHERAANAELETERLRAQFAWRRLSAEQIEKFLSMLADKPKFSIRIEYVGDDPETNTFAREIGGLFKKAGWNVGYTSASYANEVVFGLRVPLYAPPNLDAIALARMAFNAAFIEISGAKPPQWFMGNGSGDEISIGSPCAHLYVGPKPAPSSDTSLPAEVTRMSPEEAEEQMAELRSRMQSNEPLMIWPAPIESPLTITREDDGTLLLDCRSFRLAGIDDAGIARFRVSPDAANELAQYFSSLEKRDADKQ